MPDAKAPGKLGGVAVSSFAVQVRADRVERVLLGWVLAELNNYSRRLTDADNIVTEIALEELYRDVRLAERGV